MVERVFRGDSDSGPSVVFIENSVELFKSTNLFVVWDDGTRCNADEASNGCGCEHVVGPFRMPTTIEMMRLKVYRLLVWIACELGNWSDDLNFLRLDLVGDPNEKADDEDE